MSVTVYKEINFGGIFARLKTGLHTGRRIVGCPNMSNNCEELNDAINSIRVDVNTVVCIASESMISARNPVRVLIGPTEISDLSTIGMSNNISSILVMAHLDLDAPSYDGATICNGYSMIGRKATLARGDYNADRLASEEIKIKGEDIVSLRVESNFIAILYSGKNFESSMDAIAIQNGTYVDDIEKYGMSGRIGSIKILYNSTPIMERRDSPPPHYLNIYDSAMLPPQYLETPPQYRATVSPPSDIDIFMIIIFIVFICCLGLLIYVLATQ
jgi:hypothetical protein